MSHFLPRLLFPAVANPGSLTDNDTHNFRALPLSFEIAGSPKLLLQKLELCEALLMRHSLARTLNVVLFLFAFLVPVSFFGQNQGPKKPTRSSGKTASETVLQADEGPLVKVKTPIRRELRTPSTDREQDQGDAKPVEAPSFRVMSRPREDRLKRGKPFHGDLRTLPQTQPEKFERPEFEEPKTTPVPFPGTPSAPSPSSASASINAPAPSAPAPSPSSSFEGLDFLNWGAGHPPDTNGDVGPTYYIQ